MKLILFLLFLSANLYATEVRELSQGACWVKETLEEFSFISFKERFAEKFREDDLGSFIQSYRDSLMALSLKEGEEKVEGFVHCGSYGSSIVLNILHNDESRFCLWYRRDKGEWTPTQMGLLDYKKSGPCFGQVMGKYLLKFDSNKITPNEMSDVTWKFFQTKISEIRPIGTSLLSITMNRDYFLQNEMIVDEFHKLKENTPAVLFVEPSYFNNINGDFYPVKHFTFTIGN